MDTFEAYKEDEGVRIGAENAAQQYLDSLDDRESRADRWMWSVLWFALGSIFGIIAPSTLTDLISFLK